MISKAKAIAALGRSPRSESRGAFDRDLPLGTDGSGAPSRRLASGPKLLIAGAATLALLAFAATLAFAGIHVFDSSFGSAGSGAGQLQGNAGAAIDQSNGDLYVADAGNFRVDKFDSAGNFLLAFGAGVIASGPDNVAQNEQQVLTVDATGGTFTLSFESNTTSDIAYNASVADVQTALEALPNLDPGDVQVTGADGGPWTIEFTGTRADANVEQISADPTNLTGGGQTADVQTTQDGGAAFEICKPSNGDTCQAGIQGTAPGVFSNPQFVAVDNSGGASAGDVYVGDQGDNLVSKFDSSGNLISGWGTGGQLDGSSSPDGPFGSLNGIAVNANGVLYAYAGSTLFKFADDGTFNTDFTLPFGTSPVGIAVDSAGSIYKVRANGNVAQLDSSGAVINGTFDSGSATSISVDPASDEIYVGHSTTVARRNSGGTLLEQIGGGNLQSTSGLAVDGSSGDLYVSDSTDSAIAHFTIEHLPPVITNAVIFNLTPTEATIRSNVNNELDQLTACHFDYGTDTSYGASVPCDAPVAPASVSPFAVSAHLTGLTPGSTYHYRLVATGPGGTTTGPDASFTTPNPSSPTCTNDALRTGLSAALPDCRAYEQVSAVDKNGQDVYSASSRVRVAPDGNSVLYPSLGGFGDAQSLPIGTDYLAQRSAGNWQSHNVYPVLPPYGFSFQTTGHEVGYFDVSPDLSAGVFFSPYSLTDDPNTKDVGNFYLRPDLQTPGPGTWELASPCPACSSPLPPPTPDAIGFGAHHLFVGASADLGHIVFESPRQLTPGAPGDCAGDNLANLSLCPLKLYEWDNGTLRLASVLPDASPSAGNVGFLGLNGAGVRAPHAVSADGSRIVFQGSDGNLYQRVDGTSTIQVNASEKTNGTGPGGTDPSGPQPAGYADASADGTRVFFTSTEQLTNDATDATAGIPADPTTNGNLYMYDANAPAGQHLTFISPIHSGDSSFGTGVEGVIGTSADGHYIYWMQSGARLLANQPNGRPSVSDPFVYVWHEGAVHAIARLDHFTDIGVNRNVGYTPAYVSQINARVSPDGHNLLFTTAPGADQASDVGPTGYHQGNNAELYLYNADNNALSCATCNPSGAAATHSASDTVRDPLNTNTSEPYHINNALSADGRFVFFSTAEKLVPQDTNGATDAYQYDSQTGQLHLLSTGTDPNPSYFLDASPDGSNVLIDSFQPLVRQDGDQNADAYDLRINGGLAAQNQPPAPPPCTDSSSCHGAGSGAPGDPGSGSSGFSGPGNQGKSLGGLAGTLPKRHKKCRKHHHCSHHRRADAKRGGAK